MPNDCRSNVYFLGFAEQKKYVRLSMQKQHPNIQLYNTFVKFGFHEMIIQSASMLILINLFLITGRVRKRNVHSLDLFVVVTRGDGGCRARNLVACLNETDCISQEQVCLGDHRCVDSQGRDICL